MSRFTEVFDCVRSISDLDMTMENVVLPVWGGKGCHKKFVGVANFAIEHFPK